MPAQRLPDQWYYLKNFEFVLHWVARRYDDLLQDDERHFIRQFPALPRASRALAARMIMRKGPVFRASRLRYPEIGDIPRAMAPLLAQQWVCHQPAIDLPALFKLLTRRELSAIFRRSLAQLGLQSASKAVQCDALLALWSGTRTLAQWLACSGTDQVRLDETLYEVQVVPLCERLRLMFFGNLRQDWSEFVLADLGLYSYETVDFHASARAFQSRHDIDAYLQLHRCRERLDSAEDADTCAAAISDVPIAPYDSEWLENRRGRLLYHAGGRFERMHQWQRSLHCYTLSTDRGARARRVRMLERLQQAEQALTLAREILDTPASEAEQQAVLRMLPRLQRHCGHTPDRRKNGMPAQRDDLSLPAPTQPMRIEEEVRLHLHTTEAPAFYVENTLFNTLFGLLCWDAVFASVPGAFFHPYQQGPADLLRSGFRQRRGALFNACLAQLGTDSYRNTIMQRFESKHGLQSPFVYWGAITRELLELALHCIPAAHLGAIFHRLLDDIRDNRAGLPDLIQFWPAQRRYRLIEVKGPGDRLQDNQIRWLGYCVQHGIDTRVCHVNRAVSS